MHRADLERWIEALAKDLRAHLCTASLLTLATAAVSIAVGLGLSGAYPLSVLFASAGVALARAKAIACDP